MAVVPGTPLSMLQTMIHLGIEVCGQVLIVGQRRTNHDDHRVLWIDDRYPGEGPLGGLVTAGGTGLVAGAIVIGVDQPYVTVQILRRLELRASEAGVPICYSESGIVHPLPVAMDLQSVAAQLKAKFIAGERSLRTALQGVGLQSLEAGPGDLMALRDVDRPTDFRAHSVSITDG